MNCIKFPNKKITFESFLSGVPARDYVFQNMPYEAQIQKVKELLAEAEYVLPVSYTHLHYEHDDRLSGSY